MAVSVESREIIQFIRTRDYVYLKELGRGACGRTVLLHDDQIDEQFVCKKFTPCDEDDRPELFASFVREIKILHQVYHENIVRVFNYYLYPAKFAGFILMEFVDGLDIEDFLNEKPEMINEVFLQVIEGFKYLEERNILHRDIRPTNILVCNNGLVKIIDFGFGKQIQETEDFDKSVSLNWWCELPSDFSSGVYNFTTEVYFVGKLFEQLIVTNQLDQFKYTQILRKMCENDPSGRILSFSAILNEIRSDIFFEIQFDEDEKITYRSFADELEKYILSIDNTAKYQSDIDRIQTSLENAYRKFMLEEKVPNSVILIRCLVDGGFYYKKGDFPVYVVKDFVHLLKSSSAEKKRIILSNIHTRLDAIERYNNTEVAEQDDDIPF